MYITHIELNNFRNYRRLDLDVGPSVNIFYGDNAQGKTNLIEAINVCSCLSSHRTAKDKDMIYFGQSSYEVKLSCVDEKDSCPIDLSVSFTSPDSTSNKSKRVLKQDGMQITRIAEYLGVCNTVIFAPEDLYLIKGAPSVRRKFLNLLITKVSPSYFNLLNRINRLNDQKNTSLKSCSVNNIDHKALDFWDYSIADISAEIIMARYRYSSMLQIYASAHHSTISAGAESLRIKYMTITGCIDALEDALRKVGKYDGFISQGLPEPFYGQIKAILAEQIYSKLVSNRSIDVEKGFSAVGIHKDDLDVQLNSLSMRSFSSQGQQRSAALSLKLAELEIIKQCVSSSPILLLDDVFSELDVNRRVSLISGMVDAQIFITCTDRAYIEKELSDLIGSAQSTSFFHVSDGKTEVI